MLPRMQMKDPFSKTWGLRHTPPSSSLGVQIQPHSVTAPWGSSNLSNGMQPLAAFLQPLVCQGRTEPPPPTHPGCFSTHTHAHAHKKDASLAQAKEMPRLADSQAGGFPLLPRGPAGVRTTRHILQLSGRPAVVWDQGTGLTSTRLTRGVTPPETNGAV